MDAGVDVADQRPTHGWTLSTPCAQELPALGGLDVHGRDQVGSTASRVAAYNSTAWSDVPPMVVIPNRPSTARHQSPRACCRAVGVLGTMTLDILEQTREIECFARSGPRPGRCGGCGSSSAGRRRTGSSLCSGRHGSLEVLEVDRHGPERRPGHRLSALRSPRLARRRDAHVEPDGRRGRPGSPRRPAGVIERRG